jgi:hypothetical protein
MAAPVERWLGGRAAPAVFGAVTAVMTAWVWGGLRVVPVFHDEAAYLLQARIFASGRWASPAPPLPEFFEQFHVLVTPVVASKYPPGQSLLMAPGALLGLPGLVPVIIAPVPLLRLTPTNEESAGPLDAARGSADKKPTAGWGFSLNIGTNKPPNNQYPSLNLRPPPTTKPAEKQPTVARLDSFTISKPIDPPAVEQVQYAESSMGTLIVVNNPGSYLRSNPTPTFTAAASAQTNVTVVKSGTNSSQMLTSTSSAGLRGPT